MKMSLHFVVLLSFLLFALPVQSEVGSWCYSDCPETPLEQCDFYFEGFKDQIPTFFLEDGGDRAISPFIQDGVAGEHVEIDSSNNGFCFLGQNGTKGGNQFYGANTGDTGQVWVKTFNPSLKSSNSSYCDRCLKLHFTSMRIGPELNLNVNDGNKNYTEDRRCVVFKTNCSNSTPAPTPFCQTSRDLQESCVSYTPEPSPELTLCLSARDSNETSCDYAIMTLNMASVDDFDAGVFQTAIAKVAGDGTQSTDVTVLEVVAGSVVVSYTIKDSEGNVNSEAIQKVQYISENTPEALIAEGIPVMSKAASSSSESSSSSSTTIGIVLGVVGALMVLALVGFVVLRHVRNRKNKTPDAGVQSNPIYQSSTEVTPR